MISTLCGSYDSESAEKGSRGKEFLGSEPSLETKVLSKLPPTHALHLYHSMTLNWASEYKTFLQEISKLILPTTIILCLTWRVFCLMLLFVTKHYEKQNLCVFAWVWVCWGEHTRAGKCMETLEFEVNLILKLRQRYWYQIWLLPLERNY